MSGSIPTEAAARSFCDRNGYQDLELIDGQWWAFEPHAHAFMKTPLPGFVEPLHPFLKIGEPYTVAFDLTYGVMHYRLNGDVILGAEWEWGDRASPFMRQIDLKPDASYMAFYETHQSVWFKIQPDHIFFPLPSGWVLTKWQGSGTTGMTITTTAKSVIFEPYKEAA